jgi:hypothetical protein
MEEREVSPIKLKELCEASQVQELSNDNAKKTVFVLKQEYVVTGTCSSGAKGWISCTAMRVIDQENYTGDLVPMTYWLRSQEIDEGRRERGYFGALVFYGGRKLVLYGEQVRFSAGESEEGKQVTLF